MNMEAWLRFALGWSKLSEATIAHLDAELPGIARIAQAVKEAEPILTEARPDIEAAWPHIMALLPLAQKLWPIIVRVWPDVVEATPTAQEVIDVAIVRKS